MRWLRRLLCPHLSSERLSYRDPGEDWVEIYWECHACGKSRGTKPL